MIPANHGSALVTYELDVEGMTCRDCERHVETAVEASGGIEPRADWRRRRVRFAAPPTFDPQPVFAAIRAASGQLHRYEPGQLRRLAPVQLDDESPDADADLVIIGGGSAAFAAAIEAHQLGARVIMIERGTLGGTCVNIGCVPSKFLLRAAEVAHLAATRRYRGIRSQLEAIDLAAHVAQKQDLIAALRREKYEELVDYYGWELLHGTARFVDPQTIAVGDRLIRARAFLIATGASPALPPLPGLAETPFLTSTSALDLERVPTSLLVLGAGYVALELGQAFQRLGSRVTLVQRRARLLPEIEPKLAEQLQQALAAEGIRFRLGALPQRVERVPGGVRLIVQTSDGREEALEAETLLVATGRRPNVDDLDLAAAGVELDARGAPRLDPTLRTTNPRIYAAGDVTLGPQFVYVAAAQGRLAARNALLGEQQILRLDAVPAVIFTQPQLASVGLTRADAEARGHRAVTGFAPASVIARERVELQPFGGVFLVADAESGRILGVQALASAAGELIEAATLAVHAGLTLADLREHLAPYLTVGEGLRLAALAVEQDPARLSCCA